MAGTRKITYASVSDMAGAQVTYSAAVTWGELKQENVDIDTKSIKMKPWLRGVAGAEGKALLFNDQTLPEEDFVIVFITDKNDSGRSI